MIAPSPVPILLVLSAPSGGGKTTVCEQLLAHVPGLKRAITCTTRPPRPGEQDGVHYHFLDPDTFRRRVQAGEFLEHATVHGQHYGTLTAEVLEPLRQGRDVLLNIDVQGAATVRNRAAREPELGRALVTVFLAPPSMAELERRLNRRGTDSAEVIAARLAAARRELAQAGEFDYLVVSETISEDFRRLRLILEAEHLRTCHVGRVDLETEVPSDPATPPPGNAH